MPLWSGDIRASGQQVNECNHGVCRLILTCYSGSQHSRSSCRAWSQSCHTMLKSSRQNCQTATQPSHMRQPALMLTRYFRCCAGMIHHLADRVPITLCGSDACQTSTGLQADGKILCALLHPLSLWPWTASSMLGKCYAINILTAPMLMLIIIMSDITSGKL